MDEKKRVDISFCIVGISLWLTFNFQKVNMNNIYFLLYLPLLIVVYLLLGYPFPNGRPLNRFISYFLAILLSVVTIWEIMLDTSPVINRLVALKVVFLIVGLTIFFEKTFQFIVQFSINKNIIGKFDGISWCSSFGLILIGWLIYLLIFLPGNIAGDGNFQLVQFFGHIPMTNHHPFLSTLFEGGIFNIGRHLLGDNFGLFLYVFVQLIICASIYSFCISKVSRLGINSKVTIVFSIFVGLVPYWSFASETLHKDGMFLAFFALYVTILLLLIVKHVLKREESLDKKELIGLIISSLLVCFWRNDGIYMVLPSLLCLIFIGKGKYWKQFTLVLVTVMFVFWGFNKVVLPILHVAPTEKGEALSLPAQQTARYLKKYPHDITANEKKVLTKTFNDPSQLSEKYDPNIADPVKFYIKRNVNTKEYIKVWAKMGIRHPLVYLNATFAGTDNYYVPWSLAPDFTWCGAMAEFSKPTFLHLHYINSDKIRSSFIRIVGTIATVPFINIFLSSAMAVWLSLLMGLFLWEKYGFEYLIPFIPVFMNLLICIASPVNGLVRYSGCIVFATFMLTVYYFDVLKRGVKKSEQDD